MSRTTEDLVKAILGDDYDGTTDLTPFMDTATMVVDTMVEMVNTYPSVIMPTDAKLELIERWVAAHYYATPTRPFQSAKTGDASAVYQGKTDMYLDATYYGQTAISIDNTGMLKSITSGKRRGTAVSWLGKPPRDQILYEDRA